MGLILSRTMMKNKMNELYPKYLDASNPKYLLLDNMFVGALLVSDYEKEMNGGFLDRLLSLRCDMQISLYYNRKNTQYNRCIFN